MRLWAGFGQITPINLKYTNRETKKEMDAMVMITSRMNMYYTVYRTKPRQQRLYIHTFFPKGLRLITTKYKYTLII